MYPSKITVTKARTIEKPKNEWKKIEFTIEVSLTERDNIEQAKELCDVLLDSWLKEGETTIKPTQKIVLTKTCNFRGCEKKIADRFQYCYDHFRKVTGNK